MPPTYRYVTDAGYIEVPAPPGHPARVGRGLIFEHRLFMEQRIGRYLLPEETVHHKNLKRDDNRDKNLELWASRHPKGARVSDLIEYVVLGLLRDAIRSKPAQVSVMRMPYRLLGGHFSSVSWLIVMAL